MSMRNKARKAWIITWDWAGDHAAVSEEDVVAAVLRPQTSPETVRRITEVLYAAREYAAVDKLDSLVHNPYPATFNIVRGVPYTGQIHCGHNPWLYARLVDDLGPKEPTNADGGLIWRERPHPSPRGNRGADFVRTKDET